MRFLDAILRPLRLLLLGLWLGASLFFGTAVAPNLFGVLRSAQLENANEIAGMIVQRLLAIINRGGFEIGLFLFVTAFFVNRFRKTPARFAEVISLAIMAIMTGIGQWVISAKMAALRAAMQAPIDQLAFGDSRRVAFDSLHRYSVLVLGVAMIAGLIAFAVMAGASAGPKPES